MTRAERRIVALRVALWTILRRGTLILVSGLLSYQVYQAVMPGSWFLNYKSATVSQTAFAHETITVEFCRDRLIGSVDAQATRIFFRSDSVNGKYVSTGEYRFFPNIENSERCVNLPITPQKFDHTAGFWKFHTDLTFKVGIYEKTTSYDSNVYQVREQPSNAQLQIDVQQKIDDLQSQLNALKAAAVQRVSGASTQPRTSTTTVTPSQTAQTNVPTTSAPPEQGTVTSPSQPVQSQPGFVESLLAPVTNVTRGLGL